MNAATAGVTYDKPDFYQFFVYPEDGEDWPTCLPCAKRLHMTGPVAVIGSAYGEQINVCAECGGSAEAYCTCGRRPKAIASSLSRYCRCRRPRNGEVR